MNPQNDEQEQQQKAMIFISNLDLGISEDYLYYKFKKIGVIQIVQIAKDKNTKKSKGTALIAFATSDQAEYAIKAFNNYIFIKNNIKVMPYMNKNQRVIQSKSLINQIPKDTDLFQQNQESYRYNSSLHRDIHRNENQLKSRQMQFQQNEGEVILRDAQENSIIKQNQMFSWETLKLQSEMENT